MPSRLVLNLLFATTLTAPTLLSPVFVDMPMREPVRLYGGFIIRNAPQCIDLTVFQHAVNQNFSAEPPRSRWQTQIRKGPKGCGMIQTIEPQSPW
jgi:hypothetical protein